MPDALAQLGDALVADEQFDRAKEIFEQLVERQPDSDSAKRKLNSVLRRLGLPAASEAPDEVPEIPEDHHLRTETPKAPTPTLRSDVSGFGAELDKAQTQASSVDPQLDEETQKFIAQSLTDVDLIASYGLKKKAIGLLEAILRRAPRHAPTLEKLLDFVLGAGDDRRTAELAGQLEQLHNERGDARSAERFEELRRRFQRAAGLSDEDLAPLQPAAAEPVAEAAPPAQSSIAEPAPEELTVAESPVTSKEEVHEVDLSDEWASMLSDTQSAEPAAKESRVHQDAAPEFEIPIEAAVPENTNPFAETSATEPAVEDLPEISIRREAHETASIFEKDASSLAPAEPAFRTDPPSAPK